MPDERHVELVGVPAYMQGHADYLCVYYSMSMMLAALFPKLRPTIHDSPRYRSMGSPVFQAFRYLAEEKDSDFGSRFSRWFFEGMSYAEACKVLDAAAQRTLGSKGRCFIKRSVQVRRARRFKWNRKKAALLRHWTAADVFDTLDQHLPVLACGDAHGAISHHAVLIVGYRACGHADREVLFHDPSTGRLEARPASEIFCPAEVVVPVASAFRDFRPDKLVTVNGETTHERWQPEDDEA